MNLYILVGFCFLPIPPRPAAPEILSIEMFAETREQAVEIATEAFKAHDWRFRYVYLETPVSSTPKIIRVQKDQTQNQARPKMWQKYE